MPIPAVHASRSIYHFTHIDNLPGLLKTGFLAKNHSSFPDEGNLSIAEPGIQETRAKMKVTCGPGGFVHDYVPLYFGSLSLMLLGVVKKKNVDQFDILYFEYPISLVNRDDVVFTSASANTMLPPNFYSDPTNLNHLNWNEIDSLRWSSASDTLRHQRMAEVLVHNNLPLIDAQRVVVWNDWVKGRVEEIVKEAGVAFPKIEAESPARRHYFINFMEKSRSSIAMGPRAIAMKYHSCCEEISKNTGQNDTAQFETPKKLLEELRKNFGCLPQTTELIGLKSENSMHNDTVDVHTLAVVKRLKSLPEILTLSAKHQEIIELSAYLHDIGKGPKSRWVDNGGVQKVDPDHAARAMPMMVDIFKKHVGKFKLEDAKIITKLVCYHDLVGEVLGKGRDEQQITDVADNELELAMLFALGKADATSVAGSWWNTQAASSLYGRCLVTIKGE